MPVVIYECNYGENIRIPSTSNLLLPFAGRNLIDRLLDQLNAHFKDYHIFSDTIVRDGISIEENNNNVSIHGSDGLHSGEFMEALERTSEKILIIRNFSFALGGINCLFENEEDGDGRLLVLVKEMKDPGDLTQVFISPSGEVVFEMDDGSIMGKWVDLGIYCIDSSVMLDYLRKQEDDNFDDLIRRMIREIGYAKRVKGQVGRLSNIMSVLETQRMIMDSNPLSMNEEVIDYLNRVIDLSINTPIYIEDGIKIGERSRIGPYVTIMKGVTIGDDVYISNSIIIGNATIGSGCYIEGAVVKKGCILPENTELDWGEIYDN